MNKENEKLMLTILLTNGSTSSCLPCPMMLLTILLVVEAKAHEKTPNKPKIFLSVLEIASARSPWCSIKM